MKRKLQVDQKTELKECVDTIERLILKGYPYIKIKNDLEAEFGSRYGTLRNVFSEHLPYPINTYIKRRMLTVAYMEYRENPVPISTRTNYKGIDHITDKFYRAFELRFCDDHTEDELQPKFDVDEIWEMHKLLKELVYIDDYDLEGDHIKIDMNYYITTVLLLQLKTYYCPIMIWEQAAEQFDDNEKVLFLELIHKSVEDNNNEITVPIEDLEKAQVTGRFYDYNKPTYLNNWAVFTPEIPAFCEEAYHTIADEIIANIKTGIPSNIINKREGKELDAISKSQSFDEIANEIGVNNQAAKKKVWEYLASGYLRFFPEQ